MEKVKEVTLFVTKTGKYAVILLRWIRHVSGLLKSMKQIIQQKTSNGLTNSYDLIVFNPNNIIL